MSVKWLGDTIPNQKEKPLLARYAVTGTSWEKAQVTVDTTADTLTIVGHGLVNGDQVGFGVLGQEEAPKCGQQSGMRLYVINVVGDTFQLSTTSGGAPLDFTTTGGAYWKLFKNTSITAISFTNINAKQVRVMAKGNYIRGTDASGPGFGTHFATSSVNNKFSKDLFHLDVIYSVNDAGSMTTASIFGHTLRRYQLSTGGVNVSESHVIMDSSRFSSPLGKIGTVLLDTYGQGYFCEGTVVEVYEA